MIRWFVGLMLVLAVSTSALAQSAASGGNSLSAYNTATGSISALNGTLTLPTKGYGTVGVQITGTFTATVVAECSLDAAGSLFKTLTLKPVDSDTTVTSVAAPGIWTSTVATCALVRIKASAYTSGTITAVLTAVSGASSVSSANLSGDITVTDVGITSIAAGDNNIGNVDVVSLPALPAGANTIGTVNLGTLNGAATAAKQPALGTAGSPSTDVISIQGVASGTVVPVSDGGSSLTVDGTIACSNCSGSGVSVNEDVASANADPGTPAYSVRNDTVTGATSADGDYQPLKSDSAGRLWVNGTGGLFPATQSGTWTMQPGNTANTTPWLFTVSQGGNAATVNGSGQLSVTCANCSGSGVSSLEDAASANGDAGTPAYSVRQDSIATSTSADGDYQPLKSAANGSLYVSCTSGCSGSGGTSITDDAAFTVATTTLTPVGGTYKSTRDAVDDNDAGAFAMTAKRGLYVSPETPNGDSIADDTLDTLKVSSATAANFNATVVGTGTFVTQATTTGAAAHDAVASGNPVLTGGYASSTAPTAVSAAGDVVRDWRSLNGATAVFVVDSSGNVVTPSTDATQDSAAGTTGPQVMALANSSAPTDVTAGDAVRPWADLKGRLQVNISQFGGVTPSAGNGTSDTGTLRVAIASNNTAIAGVGAGATGSAPPANAGYTGGVTSGATGGLLTGDIICDSQGWLDMTTATTTEIAPLVASRTIYICSILAQAGGTTTMTLKRGTGTNCGTGTTSISPGFELTAQSGFAMGTGKGVVVGPVGAGTVGGGTTSGNAVCVTNSAAVNLHVLVRYAVF